MRDVFKLKGDKVIWILIVLFAMISIVAVFSSSSYLAAKRDVAKTAIFLEQTRSVLLGFVALFICYLIPLRAYRALSFIIFFFSVVMLIMLYIPGMQDVRNGAVRGIKIFGVTFQVFEFAKIAVVLYLARALELWDDSLYDFKTYALRILLPIAAVCLLILPNSFSSALLIALISFLIMFFMDMSWKNILITVGIVAVALLLAFGTYHAFVKGKPTAELNGVEKIFNRFGTVEQRFENFMGDDQIDVSNLTPLEKEKLEDEQRQSNNAKVAISQGGIFGKGPGKSTQRYSLSMAFSDFIYAFIVEEYGLLGGIVLITLYIIFLFRCIRLCGRCKETFASVVVVGLSFLIACQAFLHILVNVRLIPITGHTLPLISHGGTAYLVLSGAFGIILSVNKQLDKQLAYERQQQKELEESQLEENV